MPATRGGPCTRPCGPLGPQPTRAGNLDTRNRASEQYTEHTAFFLRSQTLPCRAVARRPSDQTFPWSTIPDVKIPAICVKRPLLPCGRELRDTHEAPDVTNLQASWPGTCSPLAFPFQDTLRVFQASWPLHMLFSPPGMISPPSLAQVTAAGPAYFHTSITSSSNCP